MKEEEGNRREREEQEVLERIQREYMSRLFGNKYKGIQVEFGGRIRGALRATRYIRKKGSLNQQSYVSRLEFTKRSIFTR